MKIFSPKSSVLRNFIIYHDYPTGSNKSSLGDPFWIVAENAFDFGYGKPDLEIWMSLGHVHTSKGCYYSLRNIESRQLR
jgi:hypothetical protein